MMWTVTVVCALVAAGASQSSEKNWRDVTIAQGSLRGFKAPYHDVFQYLNVPYASAPVGPNRFKAPLPPPIFIGTIEAIDRGIICPQVDVLGQEDCLVANIYVPNTNDTNLPVVVIVHGGAYFLGWGTMNEPNDIVSGNNMIVVTFNYRLGPHGFLCLGTEDAPGNAGMKDQVALLRWVRDNIADFGGNPNDVTLYGCSAGGSSVDLLALSSMTDGLFSKVIAESGCSMNVFSMQMNPLQTARNHALSLGFNRSTTDLNALAEFYKTSPIHDLFDASWILGKDSSFVFQPCVEKDIGEPRFLEEAPITILKSGNFKKIPFIYGYAKQEGLFRLNVFDEWSVQMNDHFEDFLPADLQFESGAQKVAVAQEIKESYFGKQRIDENTILEYLDYFTDALFLTGILRAVALRVQAGQNNIYFYEYSFTYNGSLQIPHTQGLRGANHCDQFILILDFPEPQSLQEEQTVLQAKMREAIYNFISNGNPTPGSGATVPLWPPAGSDRSPHLSVGDTITVAGVPTAARTALWDSIYERHAAVPQPPIEVDPTPSQPDTTTVVTTETTQVTIEEPDPTTSETTDAPKPLPDTTETPEPLPDSASLLQSFSLSLWVLYAVVVVMIFK